MRVGLFTIAVLMNIVAVFALVKKRNDYADVVWGPGFFIGAFAVWWSVGFPLDPRALAILAALGIWAFRLFFHLGRRNLSHNQEDARYVKWRKEWGATWVWRSYLQVFILQGILLWLILSASLHAIAAPRVELGASFYIGLTLWVIGFLFEAISDEQLRRFKKEASNKGKLMTTGLWSLSRHPNYFGEVVLWWGVYLMTAEVPGASWTVISPVVLTILILKVSGVPLMEKQMEGRPGFAEYSQHTSKFLPWLPRG